MLPNSDSGHSSNVSNSITNVFLRLSTQTPNVLLVGATNRPWAVDPRTIRFERFETMIEVPLPDTLGRLAILQSLAKKYYLDTHIDWQKLADATEGFSPADIISIINAAAQNVFMDSVINDDERTITQADIQHVLDRSHPSVSKAQLQQYIDFKRQHNA